MSEYNVDLEIEITSPDMEKNPNGRFEFKEGEVICINEKKAIVKKGKNIYDCSRCIFQEGNPIFYSLEKWVLCNSVECRSQKRKDKKNVYFKEVCD